MSRNMDGDYRVKARFNDLWMVSEDTFDEHGVAVGVAAGLEEIRGADETEVFRYGDEY